jgi:hypothetical protein
MLPSVDPEKQRRGYHDLIWVCNMSNIYDNILSCLVFVYWTAGKVNSTITCIASDENFQ